MGSLIYFNSASLDGYIAGRDGKWDWATPDAEVHSFVNDLIAPARTYLYGRRVWDVMKAWDDFPLDDLPPAERAFAEQWREVDKIVYSRTIDSVLRRCRTSAIPGVLPHAAMVSTACRVNRFRV